MKTGAAGNGVGLLQAHLEEWAGTQGALSPVMVAAAAAELCTTSKALLALRWHEGRKGGRSEC